MHAFVFQEVRKVIIKSILATDMTCHFALKTQFDAVVHSHPNLFGEVASSSVAQQNSGDLTAPEREIIMKSLLHAADISNPCRSWESCKRWSGLVIQEFFAQGDLEKAEGLVVSANMDRDVTDQAQLSLDFADLIVSPFIFALATIMPVSICCHNLGNHVICAVLR